MAGRIRKIRKNLCRRSDRLGTLRMEIQIRNDFPDDAFVDGLLLVHECQRHRIEADVVDIAWNSLGILRDDFYRLRCKHRRSETVPRYLETVSDIVLCFLIIKRFQPGDDRNSLS